MILEEIDKFYNWCENEYIENGSLTIDIFRHKVVELKQAILGDKI